MEARHRSPASDLSREIGTQAFRFDFFQLVYLLERWIRAAPGQDSPRAKQRPIGFAGPLVDEGLRLRPDPRLAFSPADVRRLTFLPARPDEADEPPARPDDVHGSHLRLRARADHAIYAADEIARIDVNFMGIYGVAAPGPLYFSELLNDPTVEEVAHLRSFLDLFNHRVLSFYYRAWAKYRYPYRYERGAKDDFSTTVLAFAGLRDEAEQRASDLHVPRLIKYTGLLSMRTRPLAGLRRLVADYLRRALTERERHQAQTAGERPLARLLTQLALRRVAIRSWMLRMVTIPDADQNRLGARNCVLGRSLTLGEATPNRTGKFRVRLGPLTLEAFRSLLPAGEPFRELCALVRLWVGGRLDFDIELVLRRQEVPEAQLGAGVALGWTSWITSAPGVDRDPSIVFAPRHPERPREVAA